MSDDPAIIVRLKRHFRPYDVRPVPLGPADPNDHLTEIAPR